MTYTGLDIKIHRQVNIASTCPTGQLSDFWGHIVEKAVSKYKTRKYFADIDDLIYVMSK